MYKLTKRKGLIGVVLLLHLSAISCSFVQQVKYNVENPNSIAIDYLLVEPLIDGVVWENTSVFQADIQENGVWESANLYSIGKYAGELIRLDQIVERYDHFPTANEVNEFYNSRFTTFTNGSTNVTPLKIVLPEGEEGIRYECNQPRGSTFIQCRVMLVNQEWIVGFLLYVSPKTSTSEIPEILVELLYQFEINQNSTNNKK